jgi:hypothetical protein
MPGVAIDGRGIKQAAAAAGSAAAGGDAAGLGEDDDDDAAHDVEFVGVSGLRSLQRLELCATQMMRSNVSRSRVLRWTFTRFERCCCGAELRRSSSCCLQGPLLSSCICQPHSIKVACCVVLILLPADTSTAIALCCCLSLLQLPHLSYLSSLRSIVLHSMPLREFPHMCR